MLKQEHHPVVLLTGSSSGIGLALAGKLYRSSFRVVATARAQSLHVLNDNELFQRENFIHHELDVTSEQQREGAVRRCIQEFGRIDILINNAGIAYRAVSEHMSRKDEYHQANVNYFGPMELVRSVLPYMREQRAGRIINVSSVGGMMAMPTMSSYSASKFALEGATESLWYELKPWNIAVSLVQPGFVHSDSFTHVYVTERTKEDLAGPQIYEAYYRNMGQFISTMMRWAQSRPEDVAEVILRTMRRTKPALRIAATPDARVFALMRRLLPRNVYHHLLYYMLPKIWQWGPRTEAHHQKFVTH